MAILDEYPNIKVQVVVNKSPLPEYDDDTDEADAATVTKYIEARTGAEFQVHIDYGSLPQAKHDLVADLFLDGKYATGSVIQRDSSNQIRLRHTKERMGDQCFEKRFRFSQLDIVDEVNEHPLGQNLQEALKSTGEISCKLFWVEILGEGTLHQKSQENHAALGVVPEKALKGRAISHQASFGEARVCPPVKTIKVNRIYGRTPYATYVFKYRSREALKALMIIPRTPSPPPMQHPVLNFPDYNQAGQLRQGHNDDGFVIKQEGIKQEGIKRARSREESNDDDLSFVSAKRCRQPVVLNEDGVEFVDLT